MAAGRGVRAGHVRRLRHGVGRIDGNQQSERFHPANGTSLSRHLIRLRAVARHLRRHGVLPDRRRATPHPLHGQMELEYPVCHRCGDGGAVVAFGYRHAGFDGRRPHSGHADPIRGRHAEQGRVGPRSGRRPERHRTGHRLADSASGARRRPRFTGRHAGRRSGRRLAHLRSGYHGQPSFHRFRHRRADPYRRLSEAVVGLGAFHQCVHPT